MGRKSSAKQPGQTPPPIGPQRSRLSPLVWAAIAIAVAVVAVGALALRPSANPVSAGPAATSSAAPAAEAGPPVDPAAVARAEELARLGPREQSNLPPVPFRGYAPPRPPDVITAAYEFAAEHPEILSYVPCYCGCENAGHQGSHDCFVKARNESGDVVEWDEHGVECTVCIDIAHRSRQLFASGATARDIRAAIEKEFAPLYAGRMVTPHPPHGH